MVNVLLLHLAFYLPKLHFPPRSKAIHERVYLQQIILGFSANPLLYFMWGCSSAVRSCVSFPEDENDSVYIDFDPINANRDSFKGFVLVFSVSVMHK